MKKLVALAALIPILAVADETALTKRVESLEKALRLQTLTTEAVRKDNYDLACKAQREAQRATREADVRDVNAQVDMQFAEICVVSRSIAQPKTPSWLTPLAGFEPAGVFAEKR